MRYFLLLFFTISTLFGSDGEVPGQSSNYFEEFVNMMITLLFLLGFAIATLFIVKKIMRSKMRHREGVKAIKIVEKQPLHGKAALYLVDILGKSVVIGESAAGIHLITEIPAEVNAEELKEEVLLTETLPKGSFKEIIQNKLSLFFFKKTQL